jgi:agmatinase
MDPEDKILLKTVNDSCQEVVDTIQEEAEKYLQQNKLVATVGGDHSTPLGLIRALNERGESFGILQIDAHMDLRSEYEGFTFSHASIMNNVLKLPNIEKIVQVGIRDYCPEELTKATSYGDKIDVFFDEYLNAEKWSGVAWPEQARKIISKLPEKVYVSLDIDGLDPELCPHTGTPVPGGRTYYEIVHLMEELVKSGKKIIGFDLSETGNNDWDANVASRILFRLCVTSGISRGFLHFR